MHMNTGHIYMAHSPCFPVPLCSLPCFPCSPCSPCSPFHLLGTLVAVTGTVHLSLRLLVNWPPLTHPSPEPSPLQIPSTQITQRLTKATSGRIRRLLSGTIVLELILVLLIGCCCLVLLRLRELFCFFYVFPLHGAAAFALASVPGSLGLLLLCRLVAVHWTVLLSSLGGFLRCCSIFHSEIFLGDAAVSFCCSCSWLNSFMSFLVCYRRYDYIVLPEYHFTAIMLL